MSFSEQKPTTPPTDETSTEAPYPAGATDVDDPGALSNYLAVGLEAARAAGDILMDKRGRVAVEFKRDYADLVTEADRQAENAVFHTLRRAFPRHGFIGEESGASPGFGSDNDREDGLRWIVDPLDGTTNYAQGLPLFATSIALERNGQLLAGIIHAPALAATYTATRHGGAFLNGRPIRVSDATELQHSLLVTGFVHDEDVIETNLRHMRHLIAGSRGVRSLGSAAVNLAYVAQGIFEAYWAPGNHVWDVAAGVLIVEEAGGKVTAMDGGRLDLFRPRLLATNGALHGPLLEAMGSAADVD